MKKSTSKIIFNGILMSLIPAICTYLGQSDNILVWLQNNGYIGQKINLDVFRNCMNVVAIFSTFAFLTIPLIKYELQRDDYVKQRDSLLKYYKDIFETTLKNELKLTNCHVNVRIFVPKFTLLNKIKRKLHLLYKIEFHIQNVNGLAVSDMTDNLKFEVYPDKQGLVGDCYEKRAVLYDDDLEHRNETNYNLSNQQIAKTNTLKFSLVCPVFSSNEEVVAIIAFDSYDDIKINPEAEPTFRKYVLNYTQSLYECIPELFKPKGGILW